MAEAKPARRTPKAATSPTQRSVVTNGKSWYVDGDGNSAWTRRFKDLVQGHADDCGGFDILSDAKVSLIRRCAAMEIELERMEGKLSKGEEVNLDLYTRTAGHLRRYLETLGVERTARDITPSITEIVAQHRKAGATDAESA